MGPPIVTYSITKSDLYVDEILNEIRKGPADINVACGHELLREHDPGAITVIMGSALESMAISDPGYEVVGLFDDRSNTITFYPQADDVHVVSTHEFLHALGVHHNSRPGDIMNPTVAEGQHITPEDVMELGHWCGRGSRL